MASYRKRGKKWYYKISIPQPDGSLLPVERVGGDTKKACIAAAREAEQELLASGHTQLPKKTTVEELLKIWEEDVLSHGKANTAKAYRSAIHNHIVPALGSRDVRSITPIILQHFMNEKAKPFLLPDGSEKTLSHSTLNIMCVVLKKSFAYACDFAEIITRSPAVRITVPKVPRAIPEVIPFTKADMAKIFDYYCPDSRLGMAVRCSYFLGLRPGECAALRWSDVDMKSRTIHIHATLVKSSVCEVQNMPKSRNSDRYIPFGLKFYRILQEERFRQQTERFKYGPYWRGDDWICCDNDGSMLDLDRFRAFNKWVKEHIGHGSFKTLRHTHATLLLEDGMALELVSKELGHSSIAITAQVYSHVLEKRKMQIADHQDTAL